MQKRENNIVSLEIIDDSDEDIEPPRNKVLNSFVDNKNTDCNESGKNEMVTTTANETDDANETEEGEEEYIVTKKPKSGRGKVSKVKQSAVKEPKKKREIKKISLEVTYHKDPIENDKYYEIGVDEVGRGPLFGRVYTAAVVFPKICDFDISDIKDSKKFHSKSKIEEVAKYIKEKALAWSVNYETEQTIDEINILQATQKSMHQSIKEVMKQMDKKTEKDPFLLIDGNYFKALAHTNKAKNAIEYIKYSTIEGGDNKYVSIAAASILAKVHRDRYIEEICAENPELSLHYGIDSNKGYGAKKHLDGIKEHGITIWHRRSFRPCKDYV
jgi:ribonuclease HII